MPLCYCPGNSIGFIIGGDDNADTHGKDASLNLRLFLKELAYDNKTAAAGCQKYQVGAQK